MTSPLENLLIGRTLLDRYQVEGVIGRGGMSVVYRALDRRLERPVALKIVSFPAEVGPEERNGLRARLRREAASAARLSPHPNVVQIFDYGTDPELDLDFIAMELLPGEDLKAAMRRRRLPVERALAVLDGAARGLAAGHRAGIVHRDVKPANIFLVRHEGDADFELVKVLDFGIAKALEPGPDDELTHLESVPHSPAYASPEQLQPGRPLTPASDVFQLGLVAYEVLTGERAYGEEDRARLGRGEQVPLPGGPSWEEVPPEVRHMVERALSPVPGERFPDAREFGLALAGQGSAAASLDDATRLAPLAEGRDETVWMGTAPPSAHPSSPARVRARPRGRRTTLAPAAVGATAVALLVWLFATRGPGDPVVVEEEPPIEEVDAAPEAAGTLDLDRLAEEFRPLLYEAYETVREAVSDDEGEDAAAAVQEVIYDLQAALAEGDIDRYVGHYAERVDFQGSTVPRDRIRADREATVERYEDREITVPGLAIEFVEPGTARALVDRAWRFDGDDGEWQGAARDELILQKTGDRWLVIAERELERFPG